jgi:hypothetical protein
MPCGNCGKQKAQEAQPTRTGPVNPHLDSAENEIALATINEIRPEHRQYIPQFMEVIRLLRTNEQVLSVPLERKLVNLLIASSEVVREIPCPYCRRHMEYRLLGSIMEGIEAERNHYWHMFRLMVRNELKGFFWLMQAVWYRKVKTWLTALP